MKRIIEKTAILLALISFLSMNTCKQNSVSPNNLVPNLIQNPSFEVNGQPSLQTWVADTMLVKPVQDAPTGGGNWSIHLEAGWVSEGAATTFVTGQSGTGVYRLSAYVKNIVVGGTLSVGLWKNSTMNNGKIARADSAGWQQVTLIDTLTLQPNDSIIVHFSVGCCMARIPPDQGRLDLVKLERIQ